MLTRLKKGKSACRGFTLLEYCAGAAVIAGIVFVAMNSLGTSLANFLTSLGSWATDRAAEISSGGSGAPPSAP